MFRRDVAPFEDEQGGVVPEDRDALPVPLQRKIRAYARRLALGQWLEDRSPGVEAHACPHGDDAAPPRGDGEFILVVDDDDGVRCAIRTCLCRFGYHVIEAFNGLEALDLFDSDGAPPRAVVTDLEMPVMNGLELEIRLRARGNTTPVVLMTELADATLLAALGGRHEGPVLHKPLVPAELAETVHRALEQPTGTQAEDGATASS